MAGQRQPIDLILAKGKKHVTKEFIEERKKTEVKPLTENIVAPNYLSKKQAEEFDIISKQLQALKIMSETDVDAVARYIIARDLHNEAVKQLKKRDVRNDPSMFDNWSKIQDRYFKQCRNAAADLGLTISSRCRLVVPPSAETEEEEKNKFAKFKKG